MKYLTAWRTFVWAVAALFVVTPAFAQDTNTLDKMVLFQLADEWQTTSAPLSTDFSSDGIVDPLDVLFLIHNYGGEITSPTDTTPTPEPATPTIVPVTPTPTPIIDVPTMTPTPTLQPTLPPPPTITPIPTPLPCNLDEFTENFDSITSVDQSQLITYDEAAIDADARAALVSQGRLPDGKELVPWFLFDETTGSADDGAALSTPNSAAFNSEDTFPFTYFDNQVSILEVNQTFNTNCAVAPRIEFDIAFDMEQISSPGVVRDFLVIEAYTSANDAWGPIDINGDNQVITDPTMVGDGPLTQGSFDGIFDTQLDLANFDFQLEKSDFIKVTGVLPKDEVVRIAFRFESDNSTSDSIGAFIDNIRIYDAAPAGDPVITAVNPVDGSALYADTQNRVVIQGENMTPLTEVVFNSPGGAVNLIGGVSGNDVTVTLPALSDPINAATASLQITRADGSQSNVLEFSIEAAPKPVITNIEPLSFPLSGVDTFLTITGENFRPLFTGATASNSTIVVARQGSRTIPFDDAFDYDVRTGARIEVDAFRLQNLDPGDVEISVLNPLSNIESDPFTISLSSTIVLDEFIIEVGGLNGHTYEPSVETYLLQRDQAFTLIWFGEGFDSNAFNVAINGATIITNASAPVNIPSASVGLAVGQFNTTLSLSPLLIPDTGVITAEIWNTGGAKQSVTFELNDPQPPLLYPDLDSDDWNDQTLSASAENEIRIIGDNFRGLGVQTITRETPTKFYLVPLGTGEEIELPSITDPFDINIDPLFGTGAFDEMTQLVPAGALEAATQSYRLKVVNPDSGLSVTSDESQIIQFTP